MLTSLGISGTGYFIARYTNERRFESPAIQEAIRRLSQNPQIIELIGYPLALVSSLVNNRAVIKGNESNYYFLVRGPRGKLNVSLAGEWKTQGELGPGDEEYSVPDEELQLMIEEKRTRLGEEGLEKEEIPQGGRFWRVKSLVVDLGPDYRISVLEKEKKEGEQQEKQDNTTKTKRRFMGQLYREEMSKRKTTTGTKTEAEIEEIRQFKLRETYRKVGYVRFYLLMVAVFGAMGTYIYVMKNKRKQIQGTELQFLMQKYVIGHQIVNKRFGGNIKFVNMARGAIVDGIGEFEQDFMADRGFGTVFTKGTYLGKTNSWKIDSIEVGAKNKKGEVSDRTKLI